MMSEKIKTIMTRKVVTVNAQDSLSRIKEILFTSRFHHIPVVAGPNHKLQGIVTSFDLMRLNKKFDEYDQLKVEDVMTRKVVVLEPDDHIGAAAQIFLRQLFHGIPIVNRKKELVGIVTTHDVLKYSYDREYPNDELELHFRMLEFMD
jgi:CBS domain-containing protein